MQGKAAYAAQTFSLQPGNIANGETVPFEHALAAPAANRLHLLVRRLTEADMDPRGTALSALDDREDWIALCDEIGAGVSEENNALIRAIQSIL